MNCKTHAIIRAGPITLNSIRLTDWMCDIQTRKASAVKRWKIDISHKCISHLGKFIRIQIFQSPKIRLPCAVTTRQQRYYTCILYTHLYRWKFRSESYESFHMLSYSSSAATIETKKLSNQTRNYNFVFIHSMYCVVVDKKQFTFDGHWTHSFIRRACTHSQWQNPPHIHTHTYRRIAPPWIPKRRAIWTYGFNYGSVQHSEGIERVVFCWFFFFFFVTNITVRIVNERWVAIVRILREQRRFIKRNSIQFDFRERKICRNLIATTHRPTLHTIQFVNKFELIVLCGIYLEADSV